MVEQSIFLVQRVLLRDDLLTGTDPNLLYFNDRFLNLGSLLYKDKQVKMPQS